MTVYPFHPVADIFPMMSKEEFNKLCADIESHGLIEPIWLHEGRIIDGRNRYRACVQVEVEPRFREWDGKGSLTAFVISLNVHRRHMDKSQLACVAVRALPHYEEEAKERQVSTLKRGAEIPDVEKIPQREEQSRSRDLAAASVGVNPRYVSDAKRIQQEAPEVFQAMQEGKISIQDAKREIQQKNEEPPKPTIKWNVIGPMLKAALEQIRDSEDREAAIEMALRLLDEI